MTHIHRVAYTLTWDPPEVAGGTYLLSNGTTLYFHGAGVQIFDDIVDALNMTTEVLYGDFFESIEMVANGSADIGSLLLTHSTEFAKLGLGSQLSYLHPLVKHTSDVYFIQPTIQKFKIPSLAPLTNLVWISLLGLLLIVTVLTSFVERFNRIPVNIKSFFSLRNLIECSLNTIEHYVGRVTLLKTNTHKANFKTNTLSDGIFKIGLIKLISTYFFIFVLIVYTAKVISVLMILDFPVKSPEDLLQYKYTFTSYSPMHVDRLFVSQHTRELVLKRVQYDTGSNIVRNFLASNSSSSPQALLSHPDGFYPHAIFTLGLGNELCSISSFKSSVKTARSYFTRKDSELRESINLCILKIIERGLNNRRQRYHESRYKYVCSPARFEMQKLTVYHVSFALVVIGVGILTEIISILYQTNILFQKSQKL